MLKIILNLTVITVLFSFGILHGDCGEGLSGEAAALSAGAFPDRIGDAVHIPNSLRALLKDRGAIFLQYVPSLAKGERVFAFAVGPNLVLSDRVPRERTGLRRGVA